MSVHNINPQQTLRADAPVTPQIIKESKGLRRLGMLTAYDYCTAVIFDRAGLDMILVGDSLGMVMLGREDTISVTLDEIIHHCRAVRRGVSHALVIADLPFMTYEAGVEAALHSAARVFRESGVRAVKLEGGREIAPQVAAMVRGGIPVMGHIGLTPQRSSVLGGFKVQGKSAATALTLYEDAMALQEAGCFSIVIEAVPAAVAQKISAGLSIPTIGIGAGPHCDGQVLVAHDMLGLYECFTPRFVRKFAQLGAAMQSAAEEYQAAVLDGSFPAAEHSFSINPEEQAEFERLVAAGRNE